MYPSSISSTKIAVVFLDYSAAARLVEDSAYPVFLQLFQCRGNNTCFFYQVITRQAIELGSCSNPLKICEV